MKEARMSVLKMVEDGKINADDAVKLLEALSKTGKKFENVDFDFESKVKSFAKSMDDMGRELGKRLDEMGKDVEPKLKKVAQTIIEKTNECASEIAAAFKKEECCDEAADEGSCCCGSGDEPKEN